MCERQQQLINIYTQAPKLSDFLQQCTDVQTVSTKTFKGGGRTDRIHLLEFMYLVFTRMPGESYRRRLRSLLLYLCYVFRALINSLVRWFCTSARSLVLFQMCIHRAYKLPVLPGLPTRDEAISKQDSENWYHQMPKKSLGLVQHEFATQVSMHLLHRSTCICYIGPHAFAAQFRFSLQLSGLFVKYIYRKIHTVNDLANRYWLLPNPYRLSKSLLTFPNRFWLS